MHVINYTNQRSFSIFKYLRGCVVFVFVLIPFFAAADHMQLRLTN